jgi:competence protein ComEA
MNLRFPIVAAVVAVAAGTAAVRALHSSPASVPFITEAPAVAGRPARQRIARLPERIVVYVAGAVQHAGLYTLPAASRVADALRAAGGPTRDADLVAVNLAQVLSDGDEVAVAAAGDEASVPAAHRRTSHRAKHSHHQRKRRRRPRAADAASDVSDQTDLRDEPGALVDLNTADENELETLPGVGATLAQRIVAFRELTGAFASPDDLLDVAGVTQSKLDAIEPYVTAGASNQDAP